MGHALNDMGSCESPCVWQGYVFTTIVILHVAMFISVRAQLELGGLADPVCVCEASVYAVGL